MESRWTQGSVSNSEADLILVFAWRSPPWPRHVLFKTLNHLRLKPVKSIVNSFANPSFSPAWKYLNLLIHLVSSWLWNFCLLKANWKLPTFSKSHSLSYTQVILHFVPSNVCVWGVAHLFCLSVVKSDLHLEYAQI